jgi:hypothetical protein
MKALRRGRNSRGARHAPPGCRPSSRIYTPARPRRASHTRKAQASCSCACVIACPRACAGGGASCEGEEPAKGRCLVRTLKGGPRAVFKAPTGCAARELKRRAGGERKDGDHAGVAGSAGICRMREVRWMSLCASIPGRADKKAVAARRERMGRVNPA